MAAARGTLAAAIFVSLACLSLAADEKDEWKAKLEKKMTFKVPNDSFDRIVPLVSEELGLPIRMEGNDLRADGITKTKRISLELTDKPAKEVLNEIARQANTSKAPSLDHETQVLVYVIDTSKGPGKEEIVFTTRALAKKRGTPPEWFKIQDEDPAKKPPAKKPKK
jgi:hypothetical protein